MHISKDTHNFRNQKYIQHMETEFKNMFNAYFKYISYRNKLLKELTVTDEQREHIREIDKKFVKNVKRAKKRVDKDDFKV